MAEIERRGRATWKGDLRGGGGTIRTESGAVADVDYSFAKRFEDEEGTNPEELIAAAHAACYAMAFSNALAPQGHDPRRIEVDAACLLEKTKDGFAISRMSLHAQAEVPGIDEATLSEIAHRADKGCPVSNLLRPGLTINLTATLLP